MAAVVWRLQGLGLLERAITGQLEEAGQHQTSLELYAVLNPGRITAIVRLLLLSIGTCAPRRALPRPHARQLRMRLCACECTCV